MEIFVGIGSFLGGALVTAFGYTLFITSKLSTLNARFDDHVKGGAVCQFHSSVMNDAIVAKTQSDEARRRLEGLEHPGSH